MKNLLFCISIAFCGKLWANSLAAEIMFFDPVSHEFKVYPMADAVYPHTLRFDRKGILWFTVALSNKIGRFDPATGETKLVSLPSHGFFRWISDLLVPVILKVAAWFPQKNLRVSLSHHKASYSKLYSGYIGRLDTETLQVQEFESPLGGPRRMRFAPDGMLWIPSFETGSLLRLDPSKMEFKTYRLPLLNESEYETPYALGVPSSDRGSLDHFQSFRPDLPL